MHNYKEQYKYKDKEDTIYCTRKFKLRKYSYIIA